MIGFTPIICVNFENCYNKDEFTCNISKADDGTSKNGAAINIYSGIFDEVSVTWPKNCQSVASACVVSQPSEINIYNSTSIKTLNDVVSSSVKKLTGSVTINIFGGTITTLNAVNNTKQTNVYFSKDASVTLGEATNTTGLNKIEGMIANGEAQYCGVQDGVINGKGAVRFVGIVDSLEYEEVGFEITAVEQNFDFTTSCRYVYNSLLGIIDGEAKTYTAEELGGKYIYAVAIQDIPQDGTVTFKIRAFVKQGGTTYYGKEYTETYTNGKYVEEAKTLSVASLNLRNNNNGVTKENFVDARMPRIINFINTEKPDSIGVQECDLNSVAENMRDRLNSGIIDSGYVCAQEEQTSSGDYAFKNFIWYNSDTTDCTASGQYWLSETPETASKSFGTNFYISMGWAKLKNKTTGYEYVHVNTHLAVNGEDVRLKEIEVLLNKVNELTENGKLPVFLTGDMNSQPGSAEYKKLTEAFRDTRFMTTNTTNSNTYTCFGTDKDPRIIDFCLCSVDENVAGINRFQVVEKYDGGWLSDHNALLVDVWTTASK